MKELVFAEREYVEYRRGLDVFEAEPLAVFGENQVILDGLEASSGADFLQERSQIIIVPEKGVKSMVDFRAVAIRKGHLPTADFTAEIVIALEQGNLKAPLSKQRRSADTGQPGADDGDFFGRLNGLWRGRIDCVDDDAITAEFFAYARFENRVSSLKSSC